jgi:RNA-directed DNA polymerase
MIISTPQSKIRLLNSLPKLSVSLVKSLDESVALITKLQSSSDVANFLEISEGQLLYLLYKMPVDKKYRIFDIPKKTGGVRLISSPIGGTDILLEKLKPILQEMYKLKPCVHGFVNKRSIVSNASKHTKKKYVLNIDIEDFYGSINFGRIRGLFMSKPFCMGVNAATVLAHLCTLNNGLPQGSCISPILSNFIAVNLDNRLMKLAKKYGLHYTRYADDITLSTSKSSFPRSLAYWEGDNPITTPTMIGSLLENEINASGFKINEKKSRLQIRAMRQDVTGLTVNEFLNVRRSYIRKTRAMIFAWKNSD